MNGLNRWTPCVIVGLGVVHVIYAFTVQRPNEGVYLMAIGALLTITQPKIDSGGWVTFVLVWSRSPPPGVVTPGRRRSAATLLPRWRTLPSRNKDQHRASSSSIRSISRHPATCGTCVVATVCTSNRLCGVSASACSIIRSCNASGIERSRVCRM
ncbi:hypothetical protein EV193_105151 [Herbihabitans rhizosphaerae]|uniref:Uncharacterized protein n=1 Tax=Herbihabitans rhizosphaerae TaxID=1872711 RepID=A0A4V2ESH5_9PSEU|nr:hypothetical protein EV193_105151 [Herbihabitans rhizosphaerae]